MASLPAIVYAVGMGRIVWFAVLLVGTAVLTDAAGADLSGAWQLDRSISIDPATITFVPARRTNNQFQPRGGFGRGGFGRGGFGGSRPNSDQNNADAMDPVAQKRLKALTDDLKAASASMVIVADDATITVTDALKHTHALQADGKPVMIDLGDAAIASATRWDGSHLVTEYTVNDRLTLVYTYTLVAPTNQLVLRVGRKDGDQVRTFDPDVKLVYQRTKA